MNGTQQLNLVAECLKETTNFGETIVKNICDGTVNTIPWGGADWVLFGVLFTIGIGLALMVLGMGINVLLDR